MNPKCASLAIPLALVLTSVVVAVDDGGAIHGTVELRNGETHEGAIRWDGRKPFWNDRLSGVYAEDLEVGERTENVEVFGLKIWQWQEKDVLRLSVEVPFGLIRTVERVDDDELRVALVDGTIVEMRRGLSGLDGKPTVETASGPFTPDWDDVRRVTFAASPETDTAAARLYGTVTTDAGPFTGFVAWDRDERVLDATLDGDEAELLFASIAAIHRAGAGASRVVLRDGSERKLSGTNDVDDRNRGIEVLVDGLGVVTVGWDAFESFVLADPPASPPRSSLPGGRFTATVATRAGERLRGTLIWGDHERYRWETLDGELGADLDVALPFAGIRRVRPVDGRPGFAAVELRSGRTLELEGGDVEADARPIEIATPEGSRRVDWTDVLEVLFDPPS